MSNRPHFIIVGLSGGVDSAVAAWLLTNQHHHVEALFMQNWEEEGTTDCPATQDLLDAQAVCARLKIKLHVVNFAQEYWQRVFQYFLDEYAAYRTPNPDVLCNKEIKFRAFLDYAKNLGAEYIATGHYARLHSANNSIQLLKGVDQTKDQSYFLYLLNQEQLRATLFPLGAMTKAQVRELARKVNLPNQAKKDSTGICFIGERNFKNFLQEYLLTKPGDIVTPANQVVGRHDGLMFYTIGQRRGLNIGGKKNSAAAPWYVASKDSKNNRLIITQNRQAPELAATQLIGNQTHWISGQQPTFPLSCTAKVRYRQREQECLIIPKSATELLVKFTTPQWAITPGQAVVFYQEEVCLGGATILSIPELA